MFSSPHFARRGEIYDEAVSHLAPKTRACFDSVRAAISALSFRTYWHDQLHRSQLADFIVAANVTMWEARQAEGMDQAVSKLPVLCLSVVRNAEGIADRVSIGATGGLGATFSLTDGGGYPLLPNRVKDWLTSPGVVVLGSGLSEFVDQGGIGVEVRNFIDTEDIFAYYRQSGLIPCARTDGPAPVDLAAQLSFSASYHHRPGTKQDLCDLIGSCNFRGLLPANRAPGYKVPPGLSISAGDAFFLYYETFGPLYFALRMIEHGLLYHTVEGVQGHLPFGPTVRNFLTNKSVAQFGRMRRAPSVELFPQSPKKIEVISVASNSDVEMPQLPDPSQDPGEGTSAMAESGTTAEQGAEDKDSVDPNNNTEPAEDDDEIVLQDRDLQADLESLPEGASPGKSPVKAYFTAAYQERKERDARSREGRRTPERPPASGLLPPPPHDAGSPKKRRRLNDGKDDGRDRRRSSSYKKDSDTSKHKGRKSGDKRDEDDDRGAGRIKREEEAPHRPPARAHSEGDLRRHLQTHAHRHGHRSPRRPSLGSSAALGRAPSPRHRSPRGRTSPRSAPRSSSPRPGYPGRRETDKGSGPQRRPAQAPARRHSGPPPPPGAYYGNHKPKPLPLHQGPKQRGGFFQEADLRSKLGHNLPFSYRQVAAEATHRAQQGVRSSSFAAPDGNVSLARRVRADAVKKGFVADHRNLPVAESDAAVRNRQRRPMDEQRLEQIHFDYLGRYNNRFATKPQFESRCNFCGSRHCSRYTAGSIAPNCVRYREQLALTPTRRICNYRRCPQANDHHTQVCPALHQRCPRCQCRGHGPADGCDRENAEIMDRLRADFEDAADEGIYTRERRTLLCWGWYPYARGSPLEFAPTSYDDLTEMDVASALAYLYGLLQQEGNMGHFPPADDTVSSSGRRQDDDDPPPPPPPAGGALPVA